MIVRVYESQESMAAAAAVFVAAGLRTAVSLRGNATLVAATGKSQLKFLQALTGIEAVPWERISLFHLDEYVGLPKGHPADFQDYLKEHLVDRVHPAEAHFIDGRTGDPETERQRYGSLLAAREVDLCFLGIGENCHLAFNDPPADFKNSDPFLLVKINESSRAQQFGEGWFASLEDVPRRAITISMNRILKSRCLVIVAPEMRKARAVKDALERPVDPRYPATVLKRHPDAHLFLDIDSASQLERFSLGVVRFPVEFEV